MSNQPKRRGVPKQPPDTLYVRRYFSLPPDVVEELDKVPSGQRSATVAAALRKYFAWRDSRFGSESKDAPGETS